MRTIITQDSGINPINEEYMIPAQIIRNNENSYRDIIEISSKKILEQKKNGDIFKTASGLLDDYYKVFEKALNEKNDVVHLSMSSGISEGSVNAANIVANDLNEHYENKVYVIDTLTGATGGTLINEIANDYVKQNLSTKEIIDRLNELKHQLKTSFYVPDPSGFIASGRDKSRTYAKALMIGTKVTSLVNIKFRVDFNEDGNLYKHSLLKANNKKGMLKMVKNIINDDTIEMFDQNYVALGNILKKDVDMEDVISYIESFNHFKKIINKSIGGVVAVYGSEDLCGLSLVKK